MESKKLSDAEIYEAGVLELRIRNVMGIKVARIRPEGPLVLIEGRNAMGKSSIMRSLAMGIGGAKLCPARPLRDGEETGEIEIDIGTLTVIRSFWRAGPEIKSKLTIKGKKGAGTSQALLDRLTGERTMDPIGFLRLKDRPQRDALCDFVGLDLSDLKDQRDELFAERTNISRDAKSARARADAAPRFPKAPTKEVNSADIIGELKKAQEHNASVDRGAENFRTSREHMDRLKADRVELLGKIAELDARIETGKVVTARHRGEAMLPRADESEFHAQLEAVEATNAEVRANREEKKLHQEAQKFELEAEALTVAIEALDAEKRERLENATFPVKGVSVDDTGVTFNGVPFDQASEAQRIRVAVGLSCAKRPDLNIVYVREGSGLDRDSRKLVEEIAAEYKAQVWFEKAIDDKKYADKGAIVIEDGEVWGE